MHFFRNDFIVCKYVLHPVCVLSCLDVLGWYFYNMPHSSILRFANCYIYYWIKCLHVSLKTKVNRVLKLKTFKTFLERDTKNALYVVYNTPPAGYIYTFISQKSAPEIAKFLLCNVWFMDKLKPETNIISVNI